MNTNLSMYVPRISKADFDNVANAILEQYCPMALITPMPVPIEDIATSKLGITMLEKRLTEDLSIYGQMCFTKGVVEIYDKNEREYREIPVDAGTMIIDPDVYKLRNIGCARNTIAHECVHWIKHKTYHEKAEQFGVAKACRYAVENSPQKMWTDEDWMEWQANGIAPRILMPSTTVPIVYAQLKEKAKQNAYIKSGYIAEKRWIIEQLARFYNVSKQAAAARIMFE